MNEKIKILLAEDDIDLGNILSQFLEMHDFVVNLAPNGGEALELFNNKKPDICILDVMMPVLDGFTLAQKIKKINPDIPLLFLTAKSLKEDKIKGLKLGADDYICKPFEVEELVLRIQNILRRTNKTDPEVYIIGKSEFSFKDLKITTPEKSFQLTVKEAVLFQYLIKNKNKIVKREDILTDLWGEDDYFLGRSMDVFISRLRKFLAGDDLVSIETVRGVGFLMKISQGNSE